MSLRDAYQQKLEARLQEHKARLDLLRAQAKRAAANSKILAYEEIGNADKHLSDAKAKLRTLASAGGNAMAEIKTGVSRAFSDLKNASKRAADHLRANVAAPPPHKPAVRATVKVRASTKASRPARPTASVRTGGR